MKIDFDDYMWFPFALVLIFVAAKVFGFINWSWTMVFCPIWLIGLAFLTIVGLMVVIGLSCWAVYGVVKLFKKVFSHEND